MNDLELDQQLQREGDRWRSAFPTSDAFAESVAVARQTRPQRAWLTPLIAAAVVVAAVAGTVLITRNAGHRQSVASPVPWSSATVPAPSPTNPARISGSTPNCDDLGAFSISEVGSASGAAQSFERPVILRAALRYEGNAPCIVTESTMSIQLIDNTGVVVESAAPEPKLAGGSPILDGPRPSGVVTLPLPAPLVERVYQIEPGQTLILGAEWIDGCSQNAPATLLRIGMPGNKLTLTAALPSGDRPICPNVDIAISPRLRMLDPVVVDPGSQDGLVAAIHAPATVHHGQTLNFAVTVTNLSDRPVRLDPCPTYTIGLSEGETRPLSVDASYRLNCAQAPTSLAAGSSTDFEMQVSVPLGGGDNYSLTWIWGGQAPGDDRGSSTTITVAP